jgi:hypothetical protein
MRSFDQTINEIIKDTTTKACKSYLRSKTDTIISEKRREDDLKNLSE